MSTATQTVEDLAKQEYKYGFVSDVETETIPVGLSEDVVRLISSKKEEPEWLLESRLTAFRIWSKMVEPKWHNVHYKPIDYQAISYYAAPKKQVKLDSLDDVDPEVRATFDKLGISLDEQKRLSGVAVDAVFDSVSVATTFKDTLANLGIIFCSFSEAVREHPELVRQYLGSVVPHSDNFFAALNAAVFSDGSFAYIPTRAPRSAISRAARRRSATRTSCMRRSWSSWRWTTPPSSTRRSRTGIPATRTARAAFSTS